MTRQLPNASRTCVDDIAGEAALMTVGKYKGQPIEAMTTPYLAWLVSQDHIRFSRWPLVKEVLRVLHKRFSNFDTLLSELEVTQPPPSRTPTAARLAEFKAEQARKLAELEARRAEEARQRRQAARVAYLAQRAAVEEEMRNRFSGTARKARARRG